MGQHISLDPPWQVSVPAFPMLLVRASHPGALGPSQHVAVMPACTLQPTPERVIWQMLEGHCTCGSWVSLRRLVLGATTLVLMGAAVAVAMAHASRTKAKRAACGGRQERGEQQAARTVRHRRGIMWPVSGAGALIRSASVDKISRWSISHNTHACDTAAFKQQRHWHLTCGLARCRRQQLDQGGRSSLPVCAPCVQIKLMPRRVNRRAYGVGWDVAGERVQVQAAALACYK